jgi:branched-chain amino acid transport system substrate-binding protein
MTNNIEEFLMTLSRLTSISVAAVLFAAGAAAAQAETVKIAFAAGPMSGSVAQYGDMVKAGVLTAVEQINAAGGAGGNKLELVTMDDACEPKQAVAVANKIVSQKIST